MTAKLMVAGVHPVLAVLFGGILVGIILGAINGTLVNFTGLHPFIITLGTNAIFRGVTLIISGANPTFGFPYEFITALTGNIWFVPAPVVLALVVALVLWFVTAKSRLGRNIYALGGNRDAAYFSGIDVKLHTLIVFMISGVCSRSGRSPLDGPAGGRACCWARFRDICDRFGDHWRNKLLRRERADSFCRYRWLIIGTISNGLNMLQIQTFYQLVVMGSLIIAAVTLDRLIGRTR